jgi:hypothetical protein
MQENMTKHKRNIYTDDRLSSINIVVEFLLTVDNDDVDVLAVVLSFFTSRSLSIADEADDELRLFVVVISIVQRKAESETFKLIIA